MKQSPLNGSDCRWERSEWPHPKFPDHMKPAVLPDVIWLRIHRIFRGGFQDEVTGWQFTDPDPTGDPDDTLTAIARYELDRQAAKIDAWATAPPATE